MIQDETKPNTWPRCSRTPDSALRISAHTHTYTEREKHTFTKKICDNFYVVLQGPLENNWI